MVEQKPTNVREIFNSSILRIPKYQRNYSWKSKHIEDLLNDIDYLFKQDRLGGGTDDDHYFGTIVLHQTGKVKAGSDEFTEFDIVDGQQRLTSISMTMAAIAEEIEKLDIDISDLETTEDRPTKQYETLREAYIENSSNRRLDLQNDDRIMYKRLVIRENDPGEVDGETVSEERLINSKKIIQSWLSNKKDERDSDVEFYRDLLTLIRLINNRFEVTRYKVDSISEAGRIFETLNDRGRTLTIADKIKSYLVYCANRIGNNTLADDVFNQFGEVIHNITSNGTEADLSQFIEEHWRIFSGEIMYAHSSEYDINDLHRRIKTEKDHIPLQRDDSEIKEYIEEYLESLLECSESYIKVMNPSEINATDSITQDIQRILENIHRNISKQNVVGLLIALHQEYGFSEDFLQVIKLLDVFGWRAYQVCRVGTDYRRRKFRNLSHQIYYTNNADSAADIFGKRDESDFEVFDSSAEGFSSVCREIENAIGNFGPNRSFEKNLRRSDIFDGNINKDGWNGLRNKELVRYFLYEYERSLEGDSVSDFSSFESRNAEIEYILPEDKRHVAEDLGIDHAQFANQLGNLALLHPSDDAPDPELSYAEKYDTVYSSSSMAMLNELPDPSETTWDGEAISNRLDRLVEFAMDRWGVESGAYVPLTSIEGNLSESELLSSIYPVIEDVFNENSSVVPEELNSLPKIVRDPQFDPDKADFVSDCPNCGGFRFSAHFDDDSISYECDCGEELDQPLFGFYFKPFELDSNS
jgi:hypothetical protein